MSLKGRGSVWTRLGWRPPARRPSASRPRASRPRGPRPTGPRPTGFRPTGPRSTGSRPRASRPRGPRSTGSRSTGPRPRGFWSFRSKYSWGVSTYRRRANLCYQLNRGHLLKRRTLWNLSAGTTQLGVQQQRGGASASRGRGLDQRAVPTRRQLDAQLEDYMSLLRRRLDRELEDYMSLSRTRLDAQLDQYMSLAGETLLLWD
ncbi:uncharacterized protein V6R79_019127 [Siganus canaliculatus]